MRKIIAITLLLLAFTQQLAKGAPVNGMPTTIKQPSGKEITIYTSGDEYYHWLHDIDGYTIVKNTQSGYFCYATLNANGDLAPTNYVVGSVDVKTTELKPGINISSAKKAELRKTYDESNENEPDRAKPFVPRGINNVMNNIVIYIRFKGEEEFPAEQATFTEMFNSSEEGVSSMYNYFKEVSYGKLKIKSHFFPSNDGSNIISYQDSHDRNYYMPYDSISNKNGYTEETEYYRRTILLKNAIEYAKTKRGGIPSSLNIDVDKDGYVDNVCFVIRGDVSGWGTILWPKKVWLGSLKITINDKIVGNCNFHIEQWILNVKKVGVLCHEMFHSLSAPDLYHYDDKNKPVGKWDLMENDQTIPQHMCAYMKYKYGGWIDEIPEITKSGTYTLNPLTSPTNNCYMIKLKDSKEFIVIEYREKNNNGIFEKSVPGTGIIIYRINPENIGNAFGLGPGGQNDEVYVFRPKETIEQKGDDVNGAYFVDDSKGQWSSFHNESFIKCFKSDGTPGNVYIKKVTKGNGTYSFDVRFCDYESKTYTSNDPLPELVNALKSITTQGSVVINSTDNVTFEAKEKVRLNTGFKVEKGASFHTNMNGCGEK